MKKNHWETIYNSYIDEDSICHIDAWEAEKEQGQTIAYVDMLTGRVIYRDNAARVDTMAQEAVKKVVAEAKAKHPYSIERLEGILQDVVDFECEEIGAGPDVKENLYSMGFSYGEMVFFGFPPSMEDEEE